MKRCKLARFGCFLRLLLVGLLVLSSFASRSFAEKKTATTVPNKEKAGQTAAGAKEILAPLKRLSLRQLEKHVGELVERKELFSKEGEVSCELLAFRYEKMADYDKAQSTFLRLWAIRKVLYGNDKVVTLHALYCLARNYGHSEKTYDTAIELFERIVKKAQNTKSDFLQRMKGASLVKLAKIYGRRGKFAQSAGFQQRALKVFAANTDAEEALGHEYISAVPIFARANTALAEKAFLKGLATLEQRQKGRAYYMARYYAYSFAAFQQKRDQWNWLNTPFIEAPEKEDSEKKLADAYVRNCSQRLALILRSLRSPAKDSGKASTAGRKKDNFGTTAFLRSCEIGDLEEAKRLMSKEEEDDLERGPLHYAAFGLYLDMFKGQYLKKLGRKEKVSDRLALVEFLVAEGENPQEQDLLHNLPLHFVSHDLGGQIANYFIKLSPKIDGRNKMGRTALHYAARDGNVKVAALLLNKGANMREKDVVGYTPMHLAVINGQLDVVRLFIAKAENELEKGATLSFIRDSRWRSPATLAKRYGHQKMYELLVKITKNKLVGNK